MRHSINYTGRKVNGYGDCWYCNEVVVDPYVYSVVEYSGDKYTIDVCRKNKCREAADGGSLSRDD